MLICPDRMARDVFLRKIERYIADATKREEGWSLSIKSVKHGETDTTLLLSAYGNSVLKDGREAVREYVTILKGGQETEESKQFEGLLSFTENFQTCDKPPEGTTEIGTETLAFDRVF